jgi:hypothetical protein
MWYWINEYFKNTKVKNLKIFESKRFKAGIKNEFFLRLNKKLQLLPDGVTKK